MTNSIPTVGQPATIRYYTDRVACTVTAVSPSGHKVTVREDFSIRLDSNGMSECQDYTYAPNPEGEVHIFFRNARGEYRQPGYALHLGERATYHDYSY